MSKSNNMESKEPKLDTIDTDNLTTDDYILFVGQEANFQSRSMSNFAPQNPEFTS